jgi:hypothetical protein
MKTSLNLDEELFKTAKKEALRQKTTMSHVINIWARAGRKALVEKKVKKCEFQAVDLGGAPQIDLENRSDWMEVLDEDRS